MSGSLFIDGKIQASPRNGKWIKLCQPRRYNQWMIFPPVSYRLEKECFTLQIPETFLIRFFFLIKRLNVKVLIYGGTLIRNLVLLWYPSQNVLVSPTGTTNPDESLSDVLVNSSYKDPAKLHCVCVRAYAHVQAGTRTTATVPLSPPGLPEAFCQGWVQCLGACCLGQRPTVRLQQSNSRDSDSGPFYQLG